MQMDRIQSESENFMIMNLYSKKFLIIWISFLQTWIWILNNCDDPDVESGSGQGPEKDPVLVKKINQS